MEIENKSDEVDLTKITEEILASHPSKKTLINSLHALIVEFESHLDSIIKKYKIMSITILIGTGAAIGFSFSGDIKDVHINKLVMAGVVCIFGLIGVNSIWYLDIQVFHKFWGSFFIEEVRMEEKHPFLVDIGGISVSLENINARLTGDGNWYIFLNIIMSVAAGTAFSFLFSSLIAKVIVMVCGIIFALTISILMNRVSKKLLQVVEKLINKKN